MRTLAAALLLAISVRVEVAEFAEIHQLSERELRERFQLPESCDPTLAAVRRPNERRVEVIIRCAARPSEPARPAG